MEHDDYVDFYTVGMVKMRMHFPHGKADCRHCPFIRFRDPLALYQCILTDELIEKYQLDERNQHCPVELQDTPF